MADPAPAATKARPFVVIMIEVVADPQAEDEPDDEFGIEIKPNVASFRTYGPFPDRRAARKWAQKTWQAHGCYGIITELFPEDAD